MQQYKIKIKDMCREDTPRYRATTNGIESLSDAELLSLILNSGSQKENVIKNQIIKQETVSIGSLNANVVHPKEVFKIALAESAAHIIVAHNHPSGDPTPSREDIDITKKLVETDNIMGISVLDHIIIGDGRHFSMKEAGYI